MLKQVQHDSFCHPEFISGSVHRGGSKSPLKTLRLLDAETSSA